MTFGPNKLDSVPRDKAPTLRNTQNLQKRGPEQRALCFPLPGPLINSIHASHTNDAESRAAKKCSVKPNHIPVVSNSAFTQDLATDGTARHCSQTSDKIRESNYAGIGLKPENLRYDLHMLDLKSWIREMIPTVGSNAL
jgi:hypothetical protein